MNDQPTSGPLKVILPIIIVFIFVSVIPVVFPGFLEKLHIQQRLVLVGNLILFGVTILSFLLYQKAMMAGKTTVFIRNVYGGMLIKFFVCLVAAFLYIYTARESVNKAGVFVLMFLYLVYTFMEVFLVMKQSKQSKNA